MKWYFALNAASITDDDMYERCAEVAVLSALQHTSLEPYFLFDGPECRLTDRLNRLGVQIIHHRTSLSDAINSANTDHAWKRIAHGAFLRLDIPDLDTTSDYILYTDCDVLFMSDPDFSQLRPEFFAVAPEFTRGDYTNMNSGVMVMNIAGMRQVSAELNQFIRQGLPNFTAFDQGALRLFFKDRYHPLPETLNWKPYWGPNSDAAIIHFHGPKPPHARAMLTNVETAYPQVLKDLFAADRGYYAALDSLWHAYVTRARRM